MGKRKILVVDDEAPVRKMIGQMLGSSYQIIEAADGEQAIKLARSQKPDLVLIDIMMPKVDGFAACYAIKSDKETGTIPVVMLTALEYELDRKLGEKMGADGYITKPFSKQKLLETIERLLSS